MIIKSYNNNNNNYNLIKVIILVVMVLVVMVTCLIRVQPGHCFHLFTRYHHDNVMEEYQAAELLRTPLEELVLQIKMLKLGPCESFLEKALEPPKPKAVRDAVQLLKDLVSGCIPHAHAHAHTHTRTHVHNMH